MPVFLLTLALLAAPRDGGVARSPNTRAPALDAGVLDGGLADGAVGDAGRDGGLDADARDAAAQREAEREALLDVVHRNTREIHRCYTNALEEAPGLAGMLRVAWTVDANGRVPDARIDETNLDDPGLQACVLERVRAWRFPKSTDGTRKKLTWKWTLDPKARH
ncbi:MAG: AgmX/PglI C-terminal domain-containing protein [Myxococcota bacterium]|jgi:hypothetical protein